MYDILKEGRELIAEHYNSDYRVRTVSVRLLEFHAKYSEMLADVLVEKAVGNDAEAKAKMETMVAEIGKYELAFERWFDHSMYFNYLVGLAESRTKQSDVESIQSV